MKSSRRSPDEWPFLLPFIQDPGYVLYLSLAFLGIVLLFYVPENNKVFRLIAVLVLLLFIVCLMKDFINISHCRCKDGSKKQNKP